MPDLTTEKRLRRRCHELVQEANSLRGERNGLREIFTTLERQKYTYHTGASYNVILALLDRAKAIKRNA